jgi:DNA-binding Lrp family transcriptional regulator
MLHAVVLINCKTDAIPETAQTIADIEGVSEVYSVTGNVDLVAIVRLTEEQQLPRVVPEGIAKVPDVEHTETLLAFEVYSKHDLERLFSIGFEEG